MQIFQFSSSKMGHLIWELIPVLSISSIQQTVGKCQALSQPRVPPSPSSSLRQGVKLWNEGFPSGNGVMTCRSLCSAPSSTTEVNKIPEQSCICVQTATEPLGRAQACFLLWREVGYFARCLGLVICFVWEFFLWLQLNFPVPSGVLCFLSLVWCTGSPRSFTQQPHHSRKIQDTRDIPSLLLPSLVKNSCGVLFSSLTPGHWCRVEGSGTSSSRAGRAAVLQIFFGRLLSISLPLLERTGLDDSKLSLLVLCLKQLNGDLMVSEINLQLSWILPFSGMFVKQVSAVAQGTEV